MITYTILYVNNGEKLFLSEPNPSFNKDLRETATRKHIYNLPAREMMSRLITVCSIPVSKLSASKFDTALYFGPFTESLTDRNNCQTKTKCLDTLCVAKLFSRNSRVMSDRVVYNSNIDYDLPELMQDFSATSDVYFGWNNYYMCSYVDLKSYVQDKNSRKTPVVPSYEELALTDIFLKDRINIYQITKTYAEWFWWLPLWKAYREEKVLAAKQVVDDYFEKKKKEAEEVRDEAIFYEKDLDNLLLDIEKNVINLPETAKNVSLLIKTT